MEDLKLSNIPPNIQTIIEPFLLDVLTNYKENIISIYIIGSAVTKDFHPKYSDINTLIVVKENKNIMQNDLRTLPFKNNKIFFVDSYLEAVGVMIALKAGVSPDITRRPVKETIKL